MTKTLAAIFDGEVLRPDDKSGLEPNTRYRIIIEAAEISDASDGTDYPLTALLELATDMGTPDLAERHDLYAHGKLKENDNSAE